jgi:hypothetical protein
MRPLERPRCRWRDNFRIKEVVFEGVQLDSTGSRYGPLGVSFKHGSELSGSIIGGEFFDQLNDC